jgi:hypothetical protein
VYHPFSAHKPNQHKHCQYSLLTMWVVLRLGVFEVTLNVSSRTHKQGQPTPDPSSDMTSKLVVQWYIIPPLPVVSNVQHVRLGPLILELLNCFPHRRCRVAIESGQPDVAQLVPPVARVAQLRRDRVEGDLLPPAQEAPAASEEGANTSRN